MSKLMHELRQVKHDHPGERFKHAHERAREHGMAAGWGRVVVITFALISAAIGVVLVFIPGPAFVFFILTGALLATQSLKIARWLDDGEVALRHGWNRCKKKWRRFRHS